MNDAAPNHAPSALTAACVALACVAAGLYAFRSLQGELWLDELLTLTLVQADSLPKLWSGIASGIDGNPPLYLTLAWLLTHAIPSFISPVAVLKTANVLAVMAAVAVLYRAGLRVASETACLVGTFVFAALNENLVYIAFEMRTYALYFLLSALAVLFQQRLIERGRRRDLVLLGIVNAALTLSHTFGIAYVVCISLAGVLSQGSRGWRATRPIVLAACPALVAWLCWLPFFIRQSAGAKPYFWIGRPDLTDLLQSVFSSPLLVSVATLEFYVIAAAAIWSVRTYRRADWLLLARNEEWQPLRHALLLVLGMLGVTLSLWIISLTTIPLFLPRYVTPQLLVTFAINVTFFEIMLRVVRAGPRSSRLRVAPVAVVVALVFFATTLIDRDAQRTPRPCVDSTGHDFESAFVSGAIPVIAESPHVWMPRSHYALHRAAYVFPLDWDVVLTYPERARGNAADFHIMENLRDWSGTSAIMTTENIVKTFPEFLVIEQAGRAWFYNLRNTRDVATEKLAESAGGGVCTLWKVTGVKARP